MPAKKPQDHKPPQDVKFRRRDLLEAERVARTEDPDAVMSRLFLHQDGEGAVTGLGAMAMQYVLEKRSGETDLEFGEWLDEEDPNIEASLEDEDPS